MSGLLLLALLSPGCAAPEAATSKPAFAEPRGVFQDPLPVIITTDDDLLPTISPIGNHVAYVGETAGNLDIFTRTMQTGAIATRLTSHSTDDTDPVFSPDGQHIAWVSQSEDVKGDVWLMKRDGSDKHRLTDDRTSDRAPSWSADGGRVFFGSRIPGSHDEHIESMDIQSGERMMVIKNAWDPAPGPHGHVLFYVALDDIGQSRIYAHDLRDGKAGAITDGTYPEGLPRATLADGKTVVLYVRFTDDAAHDSDGVSDGDDPSSLWAVEFNPGLLDGAPVPSSWPLSTSSGSEIFAAPSGDWLLYTTAGFADLDIYALPITGMIAAGSSPELVLEAARSQDNASLRHLALRHVMATSPELEGRARYELAGELADEERYPDAIIELQRCVTLGRGGTLSGLAELEIERLTLLQNLGYDLLVRTKEERALITHGVEQVASISQRYAKDPEVLTRQASVSAELDYALGRRQQAVSRFEAIAADPEAPAEDGARSLERLGQFYATLGNIDSVERVVVSMAQRFPRQRSATRRAVARWIQLASHSTTLPPTAALRQIVAAHSKIPSIAAQAAAAQARLHTARGRDAAAIELWRHIADVYTGERAVLGEALITLGDKEALRDHRTEALDAYERVLAEFPATPELRSLARRGITRIALLDARSEEAQARRESDPDKLRKRLLSLRATYARLLRNDRELVVAHRRYIAISAQLGSISSVTTSYRRQVAAHPRDRYAQYGLGYSLTWQEPAPLRQAMDSIATSLSLDPRFAAGHLTMGWIRQELEDSEPGRGWLERSVESFDAALDLLRPSTNTGVASPDGDLTAAAYLNKGNVLYRLGKTDAAFSAYLARELSGAVHGNAITEALFRESFARVALSEGHHDVALDMAHIAHRTTKLRQATTAALLAAITLQVGANNEALHWFDRARELFAARGDTLRSIPMLRGRALVLRRLGRLEEAQEAFAEVLSLVSGQRDRPPPAHPAVRGVVTELPANPRNVTRAKLGFSMAQEEEIASAVTSRIYSRERDLSGARSFSKRRLALLAAEGADEAQRIRIQQELLYALNEAALLAVRDGDTPQAALYWTEALTIANAIEADDELATTAESVAHLWVEHPATRQDQMVALADEVVGKAIERLDGETESEPDILLARLKRWRALHFFASAISAPPTGELQAAERLPTLLQHLDAANRKLDTALENARTSGDEALASHLAGYGGAPAVVASELEPATELNDVDVKIKQGWRHIFDRAQVPREEGSPLSEPLLREALHAYSTDPHPSTGHTLPHFIEMAAETLIAGEEIEAAWRLLERSRLLYLQPDARRAPTGSAAGAAWASLRTLRDDPEQHQAAARKSSTLVKALEGVPASLDQVRQALEGSAVLIQVFRVNANRWHWFVIDEDGLHHAVTAAIGDRLSSVALGRLAEARAKSVRTVYWDSGALFPDGPKALGGSNDGAVQSFEVSEVLSASYLAAAFEARALAHNASITVTGSMRWDEVGRNRRTIAFDLPLRVEGGRGPLRSTQVFFGTMDPKSSGDTTFNLDDIASKNIDGGVAVLEGGVLDSRAQRATQQALLLAGIPTMLTVPSPAEFSDDSLGQFAASTLAQRLGEGVRCHGYRGFDTSARIAFAARRYSKQERKAVMAYRRAFKSRKHDDWLLARSAFESAITLLEFLNTPEHLAGLAASKQTAFLKLGKSVGAKLKLLRPLLGQAYQGLRAFDEAAALLQVIIPQHEAKGDSKKVATLLLDLGKTFAKAKRPTDAAAAFERCIERAQAAKQVLTAADCQSRLGSMQRELFEHTAAIRSYQQAIMGYAGAGSSLEIYPRRYLGFLYEKVLNDYERAAAQFEAARRLAVKHEQAKILPQLLIDIARIARASGDYSGALTEIQAAQELTTAAGPRLRASVALEAARIYWYRGNYRRALKHQKQSMEHARQAADTFLEIQARSLAGLIALNQGQLESAEQSMRDALTLSRVTGRKSEEAAQLNNLGLILQEQDRLGDAIAMFEQASRIDEALGSTEGRAYDLRSLGVAHHRRGDHLRALKTIDKSLELSRTIGNSYNELRGVFHRGEILLSMGSDEASASFAAAEQLARRLSVPEFEWRALYALARIAAQDSSDGARLGSDAHKLLERALSVAERLGRGRSGQRGSYRRDDLYADLVDMAIRSGDDAAAFFYAERYRSRALLDVLASADLTLPSERAKKLLAGELKAREALQKAQRLAALSDTGNVDSKPGAPSTASKTSIAHAQAARALRQEYPRLGGMLTNYAATAADLQATLPPGSLCLAYMVTDKALFVLGISRDEVRTQRLSRKAAGESGPSLGALVLQLGAGMRNFAPVDGLLRDLSEMVLAPVAPWLEGVEQLVIIPDGPLHGIPFAALPLDGEPLIARMALSRAPSGTILAEQLGRPHAGRPQHVVSFAPAEDLPFARLQATSLGSAGAILGADASEAAFRRFTTVATPDSDATSPSGLAPGAGFTAPSAARIDALDFAGHGRLEPNAPLSSALEFASGGGHDGSLRLREVFGLTQLPPVISLSACSTATLQLDGSALQSLAAAFLTAGSRTVVASLHRVSDLAAAVTMKRFYRHARRESFGAAMQRAALATRARFEHPAHWANLIVMGDFR